MERQSRGRLSGDEEVVVAGAPGLLELARELAEALALFVARAPGGAARNGRSIDSMRTAHDLVNALFAPDDEAGRARFADLLARLFTNHGKEDLATRIRADFNAPDFDSPDFDGRGAEGYAAHHGMESDPPSSTEAGGRHVMPDDTGIQVAGRPDGAGNVP